MDTIFNIVLVKEAICVFEVYITGLYKGVYMYGVNHI